MGAAAFVMAEFLQIPYSTVVIAAIIPSLLYYMTLFVLADLYAGRHGILPIEEALIPKRWPVIKAGWIFLLPFAALIYALFSFNVGADTSALVGAAVAMLVGIVFGYGGQRMPASSIWKTLVTTGHAVVQIVMIGAMAGIVIGVLNITALGFAMTQALVQLGAGNLVALLIIAALVSIVLGMGMPTLGVYLLLATLVMPSLVEVGVEPLAAHMFGLYFGMLSMITPPVAIAAFAAATIAEAKPMRTGFAAVQFGWAAYAIPFMFVLAPDVLLQNGLTMHVVIATVTAFLGIWFASTGIVGFMLGPMGWPMRAIAMVSGFLLFIPTNRLPYSGWTDAIGLMMAIPVIISQVADWRSRARDIVAGGAKSTVINH
jgi:TRAP transporter 4TM/12TM fusion protein